jgi:tetratricopeptide (TPR) repeat protein
MTLFQFLLLVVAVAIFYIFFRQLFSGDYPRRGEDFGGSDKPSTFSQTEDVAGATPSSRIEELKSQAREAMDGGDYPEAVKALRSALVLDADDIEVSRMLGVAYMNMNDFLSARETFERVLSIDADDDLALSSLANALHRLGEDEKALEMHRKAIQKDPGYAPHYYNYANTLYDMGRKEDALENYKKAYSLDSGMKEAVEMIKELEK